MASFAQRLQNIELTDDEGSPVELGSAWSQQVAVLVFIRHFG